jgi:hypothetical protein
LTQGDDGEVFSVLLTASVKSRSRKPSIMLFAASLRP